MARQAFVRSVLLRQRTGSILSPHARHCIRPRQPYLEALENKHLTSNSVASVSFVLSNSSLLLQLLMDCTSSTDRDKLSLSVSECNEIETVFRRIGFALHLKRCRLLKQPT